MSNNCLPDKDARLFLKQLLEANSVVIDPELISEKVSAIHIEEVLKCVKKWLEQKRKLMIKEAEENNFDKNTIFYIDLFIRSELLKELE